MPSETPETNNSKSEEKSKEQPHLSISATNGSTIENVVQIYQGRSDDEELKDYLEWAVRDFEYRSAMLLNQLQPEGPFKSLDYFRITDASIYFGRKAASLQLFDRVVANRLMILYARSGAGKSSILNAGLSPLLLRQARLPVYVRLQSFNENLEQEIKQAIFPPSRKPWPKLLKHLSLHEFLGLVGMLRSERTRELVIILDQFEQFLISLPNKKIHQSFIEILRDCYEDSSLPVRFVISLKHENLGDLLDLFEQYIPGILQNRYSLPLMSESELREAITGPVRQVTPDVSFEPAFLDRLIEQLGGKNVELTHLQIVCSQLYLALPAGQKEITTALSDALGGVEKILSTYLDRTLEPLPESKHKVAMTILMELVSSEGTNRSLRLVDFERVVSPDPHVIEDVLEYLVNNRLLRRDMDTDEKKYELAHAYLAEEISLLIGKEQLENKRAQDLLQRELANHRLFKTKVDPEILNYLRQHFRFLALDDDARKLLFESSLEYVNDLAFWIGQSPDCAAAAGQASTTMLSDKSRRKKIAAELKDKLQKDLREAFLAILWSAYAGSKFWKRVNLARILWTFRAWMTWEERSRVLQVLVPFWAVVIVIFVLLISLVLGLLYKGIDAYRSAEPAVGMDWVLIPDRGEFLMGMDDQEADHAHQDCVEAPDTLPGVCDTDFERGFLLATSNRLNHARLSPYEILENEVTIHQYGLCIDQGSCQEPANWEKQQLSINDPVRNITWYQASAYCAWLGGRLPTEGEWEKAARGPRNFIYPWGPAWDPNKANLEHGKTGGVRSVLDFAATDISGYNVLNLAGNVREWTASQHHDNGPNQDFNNTELTWSTIASNTSGIEILAVVRGGSWQTLRSEGMSPRRGREQLDLSRDTVGFRCVCPVPGACSVRGGSWWDSLLRQ